MYRRSTPTANSLTVPTSPEAIQPGEKTILGIDPGSRRTGYGVIASNTRAHRYLASGCIRLPNTNLPQRLREIYLGVCAIIDEYQPQELAVEQVFMARNPQSALTLGQARGVVIAAAVSRDLEVCEYAARSVKQAVVGTGSASKEQVQHMVQVMLALSGKPQEDAADALAIALCHVNTVNLDPALSKR